jgi:sugar lactone lactonase YvrE
MKSIKIFSAALAVISSSICVQAQTDPRLELVASFQFRPGNVAVSKAGRIFSSVHPLGSNKLQLIEITGKNEFVAYPSQSFQKGPSSGEKDRLDSPLGLTFDGQDQLWTIDMGLESGKTRLYCFDIKSNRLLKRIELSQDIAPKGSFVQDLVVDIKNGWAYLADIANAGIIAVDLKTEQARRFSYSQFQSENVDMVIDKKVIYFGGKPARVGVNPLTLSNDGNTLYFGAMNGLSWYSMGTQSIRERKSDKLVAQSIKKVGPKPISDGAGTDSKGNHFFTNLPGHAISMLDLKGKQKDIMVDKRINWSDNLFLAQDGFIYITVNQLHTSPAFTGGEDKGLPPYYIYRFKYNFNK